MTYRAGPCSFCDEPGRASCPRCEATLCAAHDLTAEAHCAICAKELKDDLDEMQFVRDLKQPGEERGIFVRRPSMWSLAGALDALFSRIGRFLAARRVRRTFVRRSHADIAEWRRRAGIAVRGS